VHQADGLCRDVGPPMRPPVHRVAPRPTRSS
jgi:hypothetical protein